jgi:hypothetical protein
MIKSWAFLFCPRRYWMFVDPCIIVQFIKKIQQDATMYQNFYYSIFIWSLTCFGWHTAYHQESKTALAASGFSYVEGRWTCSWWTLSGTVCSSCWIFLMDSYVNPEIGYTEVICLWLLSVLPGIWWESSSSFIRQRYLPLHIRLTLLSSDAI